MVWTSPIPSATGARGEAQRDPGSVKPLICWVRDVSSLACNTAGRRLEKSVGTQRHTPVRKVEERGKEFEVALGMRDNQSHEAFTSEKAQSRD